MNALFPNRFSTQAMKFFMAVFAFILLSVGAKAQQNNADRTYRVTAVKNGNNNIVSESNTVTVSPALRLFIPNAFSPNNDGLNDEFGIVGEGVGRFSLKIYNIWGELVFKSDNIHEKWDGTFRGESVPVSSYLYTVVAYGKNGGAEYLNGTVTILK